ncbi:MAG TPA: YicC/YloC family endoribonuclease [Spirochaetia bacterium]|nr:YicC/YloC family endoribonuclease [Spirochaetia bacterium]
MISMTGFGHGEHRDTRAQMVLEIRSYNNRFLELSINLPYAVKQFEPRVREYLSSRVQRGKVEVYLSVLELEDSSEIVVDHARLRAWLAALDELRKTAHRKERPTLAHLMSLDGVLKTVSRKDPEALWASVQPLMDKVFAEFDATRAAEGRRTQEDIRRCAADIRDRMALIEARVPQIEARIRTGLQERFRELLGDGVDESRILAETAVQLMRGDINEEVKRTQGHLQSLEEAVSAPGPQGKRLDFICQEIGREINTIGSKSMLMEIDQAVIAVKDSLEKIREQLRNVE